MTNAAGSLRAEVGPGRLMAISDHINLLGVNPLTGPNDDAVGPRGPSDAPRPYAVLPITLETDLGWSFDTDIQYGAWVFRPRSPKMPGMMRWCKERGLAPGDSIVFERLAERRFALRLERPGG